MIIRVADIHACYEQWKAKGAEFITEPKEHERERRRCYMRDPDGHLIEVDQMKGGSSSAASGRPPLSASALR